MAKSKIIPGATWYSKLVGIIIFTLLGIIMILAGFKVYSLF
ncbi:MAG TPA: hypothetical protein VFE53_17035 [Mucilaginibacter sp.]|jgi:hypothetical protein|nr:hypothetical protein [Mucilaginibacter sp.]